MIIPSPMEGIFTTYNSREKGLNQWENLLEVLGFLGDSAFGFMFQSLLP